MVNLSNLPVILKKGAALSQEILKKWEAIKNTLEADRTGNTCKTNPDYTRKSQLFKNVSLSNNEHHPEELLIQIYRISQSTSFTQDDLIKSKALITTKLNTPDILDGLKIPFRALLILLWSEGFLTLPLSFDKRGVLLIFPDIYKDTDNFVVRTPISLGDSSRNTSAYRALMHSSKWRHPKDVKPEYLWRFTKNNFIPSDSNNKFPSRFILWVKYFSQANPNIVSKDVANAIRHYAHAISKNPDLKSEYSNLQDLINLTKLSEKQRNTLRAIRSQKKSKQFKNQETPCHSLEELNARFIELANRQKPKNILQNLKKFYPALDGFDIEALAKAWNPYLEAFKRGIKRKHSISTSKSTNGYLNLLIDYIFYYLPRWFTLFPESQIKLPSSPHYFEGVYFWNRDCDIDLGDIILPPTLLELYFLRRSRITQAQFIYSIHSFFESAIYTDKQIRIISPGDSLPEIENPVNLREDSVGSGSRTTTDKVPFPLRTVPFLRAYLRLIEHIGYELQQKCLDASLKFDCDVNYLEWLDLREMKLEKTLDCKINGNSVTFQVDRIPNIFNWHLGTYNRENGELITAWIPWLSVSRMLTTELFTGQRMQNIQWLDIDSFDKYIYEEFSDLYLTLLFVTVDKTNPYRVAFIQKDIMELLLREKHFQLNTYSTPPIPILYESEDEKYGKYRPLFRSPQAFGERKENHMGMPFSDNTYSKAWRQLLLGAQLLFNSSSDEKHYFVYLNPVGKKILKSRWKPVIKELYDEDYHDNIEYCPLSLLATHTPHAMRTNLVTWCRYAGMDFEEIAIQTGHTTSMATKIYSKPQVDYFMAIVQQEKLITIMSGEIEDHIFETRGIRPSHPQSAIREAFASDRQLAISQFKMFSFDALFIDPPKSGITLCAESPVDQMVFFDHCICPFSGKCPKFVMDSIQDYQRCGLCPVAVYSVENLDAIQARMRALSFEISNKEEQIRLISGADIDNEKIEEIKFRLTLDRLEFVSLSLIARYMEAQLAELASNSETFYTREPEILRKTFAHAIPASSQFSNFIATLNDIRDFPDMRNGNFMARINRIARSHSFAAPNEPLTIDIIINKIKNILKLNKLTLSELIRKIDNAEKREKLTDG